MMNESQAAQTPFQSQNKRPKPPKPPNPPNPPKRRSRLKRFMLWLCCLALAACIVIAGVNLWVVGQTRGAVHTLDNAEGLSGDCILVLGCGLRSDGFPSQMLRDRLDVAIEAYKRGLAPKLLMSGDHGRENYDEVNAMKDYAIAQGVPSEDIFMDHAGFSTYESMYRARDIFACQRVVAVTQEYHLYRAIYDARTMGLEVAGISSSVRSYGRQWYFDLREDAARLKDVLWCVFQPEPTYLGEAIPIFGNGDATNDRI